MVPAVRQGKGKSKQKITKRLPGSIRSCRQARPTKRGTTMLMLSPGREHRWRASDKKALYQFSRNFRSRRLFVDERNLPSASVDAYGAFVDEEGLSNASLSPSGRFPVEQNLLNASTDPCERSVGDENLPYSSANDLFRVCFLSRRIAPIVASGRIMRITEGRVINWSSLLRLTPPI